MFGELYGGTTESRVPKDVEQVIDWVNGVGREPDTVTEAAFQEQPAAHHDDEAQRRL